MHLHRHRSVARLVFLVALLVFGSVCAVQAGPIGYAVQSDGDGQLYRIDLATGVATAVGPVGFPSVEGLSFQPGTGVLFGVDDITRQLITINLITGAGIAVGALGVFDSDLGLTFDASGTLFMASDFGQTLRSVNPATGAATAIGAQGQAVTGLAFAGGILFGLGDNEPNSLVTLDPLTGTATTVGALTLGSIATGDLDGGIDFDAAGVLWGLADNGNIFTIDTATGVATPVTTTLTGFEGLAIPTAAVPEPETVLLLGVGLAGLAAVRWFRLT